MKKVLGDKKMILLFLMPAFLVYLFVIFIPIAWSAGYSFFSWDGVGEMKFVGLGNYLKMFKDRYFVNALKNNFWYMFINVLLQVFGGFLVALLLAKVKRGSEFFKTMYYAPSIISGVAIGKTFQKVLSLKPEGVINGLLRIVGLGDLARSWLSRPTSALIWVCLIESYKNIGLYILIFFAALISIPSDVTDAAKLDGATGFKDLIYIKFPMIKSVFTIVLIMVVNGTLKAFDITFAATGGGPGNATELVSMYMYRLTFSANQYGYGSSLAVFIAIESIIAVVLIRKICSANSAQDI